MMAKGYLEEAVLIGEFLEEGLFEDTSFYSDCSESSESKIKQTPLMHQKIFLNLKSEIFSYQLLADQIQSGADPQRYLDSPSNDKITKIVWEVSFHLAEGQDQKKLFTQVGDTIYPYFEIINFVGELLLFVPASTNDFPLDDPRSMKILNIIHKV